MYAFHDFDFLSPRSLARILAAVGGLAALISLYRVAENYLDWLDLVRAVEGSVGFSNLLPPSVPRVSGVGDHVNIIAMAFNLILPFALALALHPASAGERLLGRLATPLIAVGLLLTVSRGAWLGTIVALPVFFLLYALRDRTLQLPAVFPRTARSGALLAAGFIGAVFLGGVLVGSQWDSRPEWLFRSSLSPRYDAVSSGWEMFRDRPWLGAGPYTYPLLYNVYSAKYPIENIHPHNGYVDALVDTGLAGGVVLAAGGLVLAITLLRAYRSGDAARRVLVAACAGALASISLHAVVETPNTWNTALMPLAVVLALTLRLGPPYELSWPKRLDRLPRAVPLAIILLLAPSIIFIDRAHSTYSSGLASLREGDYAEAARTAARAADADPDNAAYQFEAGVTGAIAYIVERDRRLEPTPALLEDAIVRLQRGLEAEPRSAVGYANLALALRLRAESQQGPARESSEAEAVDAARAAIERAPTDSTIAAVAGTVFEWAELNEEAGEAYGRALSHDAGSVQSPFWASNPVRRGLRDTALKNAALTPCEKGRVTSIYRGFMDDLNALEAGCRQLLVDKPGDARARSDLAMIVYALGRLAEARLEARTAASQVPDSPYVRTAVGVTLIPEGDIEKVRHELTLATYLGDPDAALILAYTYAGGPARATNAVVRNLRIPQSNEAMPDEVFARVEKAAPTSAPFVFDDGRQHYQLGILYYRVRFQRESPISILIPGDWIGFTPARSLLLLAETERGADVSAGR
jgi:O-antigen ligase/Flp pilus assembly protein TadD